MAALSDSLDKAISYFGGAEMPPRVWSGKYRLRDRNGAFLESSPIQTFARMADSVGAPADSTLRYNLVERRFIPAGRILFALGNPYYNAALKNCFVLIPEADSLEAICDLRKEMARTYAMGGGVGIDLTPLRPAGSRVNNAAITSSGAASFAGGFSHVTGEIGQNGRRGALMISMSVDHPDIQFFIKLKSDFDHSLASELRERLPRRIYEQLVEDVIEPRRNCANANLSVRATDRFMKSVRQGRGSHHITRFVMNDGEVIEKVFDAEALFQEIAEGAWAHGCPGILFWDTITRMDNRTYLGSRWALVGINPCGEMPLPNGGSCNLGAINLSRFTSDSYTTKAALDWDALKQAVRDGVNFLDEINTIELREGRAPLKKQAECTEALRQIGLGVMGYGDLLLQHQLRYGSDEALAFTEEVFRTIRDTAYHQSIMRAKEFGPFPAYDWERISKSPFIQALPAELKKLMEKHGLRNSNVLSIAPTGSIAILGETTSSIEPEFAFQLTRSVNLGDARTKFTLISPTARRLAATLGVSVPQGQVSKPIDMSWLPDWAVSAHEIDPIARVRTQGLIQRFIDTSISSTVNLPESSSVEDVKQVYWAAYESGCKGITIYRDGSREGILQTLGDEERIEFPIEPPLITKGRRLSFKGEDGLQRILLRVEDYRQGVPCETVLTHGKSGTEVSSYASALGIVTSIALQEGVNPMRIARALEGISAGWAARLPLDGKGKKPALVTSVPDALGIMLKKLYGNGIYEKGVRGEKIDMPENEVGWELDDRERRRARACPVCQKQSYIPDGGCWKCINPACDHGSLCG